MIAYDRLHKLIGFDSYDQFTDAHRKWVASFLEDGDCVREGKWTLTLQKSEGFRAKASRVKAVVCVVCYRDPLTTQDLKSSGFPVG